MTTTIQTIRDDFSFLDEWEDRYRYVIELGEALPPLSRCGAQRR
ncbi:sulfur transfer protein SufE [Mesorhizobium sp. URHB0026]